MNVNCRTLDTGRASLKIHLNIENLQHMQIDLGIERARECDREDIDAYALH